MQTGEISFPDGGNVRREDGTPLIGYEWGAFGMDCNGALEAAQRNGHLEIVDWRTGKSLYSEPHGRINWALIATLQNPDRVAISTDNDGRFEVVSIATRRPLWTRTMGAVVLSLIPCGDLLVVYCSDGSVSAWDEASGHLRWSLANKSVDFGLNCSADGGKLAEDDGESNVLIRDARSGRTLLTLRGHSGRINDVGFSPDGTRIVSCSRDGTVRVWDGIGGQQLTVLPDPGPHPFFCRFVEQGRRIATIDGQGFVRLYGTGA